MRRAHHHRRLYLVSPIKQWGDCGDSSSSAGYLIHDFDKLDDNDQRSQHHQLDHDNHNLCTEHFDFEFDLHLDLDLDFEHIHINQHVDFDEHLHDDVDFSRSVGARRDRSELPHRTVGS